MNFVFLFAVALTAPAQPACPIGVATIDITPGYPVRMYGYASRKTESEGVAGRLYAKAMAVGSDAGDGPAVLLTVDCGAVPRDLKNAVYTRLARKAKIKPERFVLANAHNHSGPNLKGASTLPPEHRDRLVRYGRELEANLAKVALEALASRRPCRLAWAEGQVGFAANRRVLKDGKWAGFGAVPGGAVDHSLPLLRVTDTEGKLVAIVVNYACHATTLRSDFKKIHGDWVGCAQACIEADFPGAVALICIGCGADADPCPHGTAELAAQHGRALANEVKRLLGKPLTPISPELSARMATLTVPYTNATKSDEQPPFNYPLVTWRFGNDLAMVFLTGEVVADFSLRLKRERAGTRLWISAYAHEVPCYIVSERLLEEGGYEVRNSVSARVTGGKPEQLTPTMESRIVKQVLALLK